MILTQNWEEANLALNNGSTRLEPKQGRSSDVAPVDSSTLWYKARGYQHYLMTTAAMMMMMTMLPKLMLLPCGTKPVAMSIIWATML